MQTIISIIVVVTIIILLASITMAVKQRRNIMRFLLLLGVGVVVADTVIFALLDYICYNETGVALSIISFFTAIQMGTLDVELNDFFSTLRQIGNLPLTVLFYILSVLTPLCFSGFIVSLFQSLSAILKYAIFNKNNDVYYFSDLNEKSLMLANDIVKNEPKALIVFCRISSVDENELAAMALKNGFIISKKEEYEFVKKSKKKRYYFAIGKNQSENLKTAQSVINEYKKNKDIKNYQNIKIYLYCELIEAELLMDAVDEKQISVIFINEASFIANELLFKNPLYSVLKDKSQNKLSVLLVGAGKITGEIIKLLCSVMQMGKGYSTEILVVDSDAENYRLILQADAPELFSGEYKIVFKNVNLETMEFERFLDSSPAVNYAAVVLNDDDKNLRTALRLRSYYLRKNPANVDLPFIGARIRDGENGSNISKLAVDNQCFNITAFGSDDSIYSYDLFVNSELEKLAINVHAAYQYEENIDLSYSKVIESFNRSEKDRKSNRANATHIRYKLFMLEYDIKHKSLASDSEIENSKQFVIDLCKKLEDEELLERLSKIEHDRWSAHERGEGWCSVSVEDAKKYESITNSHRNVCAKLHPCICTWDELDSVSKAFGKDIKFYDTKIVKAIPEILGLTDNTSINVSGVEYILVKR